MSFEKVFRESKVILTEGALVERLKTEFNLLMDKYINHAGLIYSNAEVLELVYRQYIDIGQRHNLPIMIMTPTRKVNVASINASGYGDKEMFEDSCIFLNNIKKSYNDYARQIMIGGLLGCKGDAYCGEQQLDVEAAYIFHKHQTTQFQNQKIDFLFAGIMPEINEAIGMAKAMADTNIPYIISFMIRKDGCLIDGTVLTDAIKIIDQQVDPKPICYMTNCIHPTNLIEALGNDKNKNRSELKRFTGIQANASMLDCEELDDCDILQQDDFDHIIEQMLFLQKDTHLKILGGCCGTDDKFIEKLSKAIIKS